ncbi:hypothetical protein C6P45_000905 [Maudiozyma exigua]|uniref:Uncharacterized protein n=1 Tax=Maudiozyma exigua TaxID=34358 RepID=A0A9P7B7Y0_MAUEX|nr:hypothetical protein C6P45_000905 [Kazachstania exigua]
MGNTDSKITNVYRDYLLQLSNNDDSNSNDFYMNFLNVTANLSLQTFNLVITNNVLRKIIISNPKNYINLLNFTISNFISLFRNFKSNLATRKQANFYLKQIITSIRIITKLIPILFEQISQGNNDILNHISENTKIHDFLISEDLITILLQLFFMEDFTIQTNSYPPGTINLIPWQIGISPNVIPRDTSEKVSSNSLQLPYLDSNRLEILNLFLTLSSLNFYTDTDSTSPLLINTCLNTRQNKDRTLLLMISILNIFAHYSKRINDLKVITLYENPERSYNTDNNDSNANDSNRTIVSSQQSIVTLKKNLISTSLQFFNLIASNLSDDSTFLNDFLKNEFQLKLLLSTIVKIFKNPIDLAIDQESNPLTFNNTDDTNTNKTNSQINSTMTNNSQSKSYEQLKLKDFTIQLPKLDIIFVQNLILLINLLKFNKTFENYFADKFSNKFLVFIIYYIKYYFNIPQYCSNIIPLCYDLALFLTDKPLILHKLLQTFKSNYYTNKLPNFFKISNISNIDTLTYRDFIIIHISNLSSADIKNNNILKSFYFEIIYNILPINEKTIKSMSMSSSDTNLVQLSSVKNSNSNFTDKLSYNATLALMNLLSKLSNKNFLSSFANSVSSKQTALTSPVIKLDNLAILLRSILVYITTCYQESKNLIFLLTRHYTVLLQIKESINFIAVNRNINNMLFLKDIPTNSLSILDQTNGSNSEYDDNENDDNDKDSSDSNFEIRTEKNINEIENYLIFNKPLKDYSDVSINDQQTTNVNDKNNYKMSLNHVNNHSAKYMATDSVSTTTTNNNNSNALSTNNANTKEYEIYEHPDYNKQFIMNDLDLYMKLRPKWPIGLTDNSKLKSSKRSDFNQLWTGASTLKILIDITKLFVRQFPAIVKMSKNSDYVDIIEKIENFEPIFNEKIKNKLPREFIINEPLAYKFSKKRNPIFNEWLEEIFWSDVFQSHSAPYVDTSNVVSNESAANANNANRRQGSVSSLSNKPLLERWSSHGSQLSRTQSNGSTMINYFSQDNALNSQNLQEQTNISSPVNNGMVSGKFDLSATSSAVSSINIPNATTTTTNGPAGNSLSRKNSNASSFLSRFSWTGFNKSENPESSIREEPIAVQEGDTEPFVIDEGLFKTNIWVGTHIKLFPITTIKKEEFSFLDMTSSLLKKFRFNSGENPDNANNNGSNSRNSNENRPYSPVLSANPFLAFASPKRF